MHKHKDTIISKGKLFNIEFNHKVDMFLYPDFMSKNYFVLVKMFSKFDVVIMEIAQVNTDCTLNCNVETAL